MASFTITLDEAQTAAALKDLARVNSKRTFRCQPVITIEKLLSDLLGGWADARIVEQKQRLESEIRAAYDAAPSPMKLIVLQALRLET